MAKTNLKRALALSMAAMMLCVAMLAGTTFAWFTDTASSTGNRIQAGNLDIDLLMSKNGSYTSIANGTGDIFASAATANNSTVTLWEPGKTQIAYLAVENDGSLALKYELDFYATNDAKNTVNAVNAFEYAIIVGANASNNLLSTVTNWEELKASATYSGELSDIATTFGKLVPSDLAQNNSLNNTDYLAFCVHMKEEADNKYEMQSVIVDVKLVATQLASENDSFGPDYDEDAVFADKVYAVDSNNSLAGTLANINAAQDDTVLVNVDSAMSWETGAGHDSTPWVDENAAVKELIVDANGNTITATGAGVGPIRMANGGTLIIKNAKIVDESVSYAENSWEFGYLEFAGNVVFENCEFVNAISIDGESAIFKNCTFNSNNNNEYAVWVGNGDATFTGCTFAGPRALKTHEAYGSEVGTIIVDNCTFDNIAKKPGVAIGTVNADTTITIKNSDFINCQAGDQGKFIYETDTDVTTFNFDCSQNNEVINVVAPDLVITTAAQLFAFANDVNVNGNAYAGKLVVLGADIDLENAEWTPVGQTGGNGVATYFQGMFDGKGYTIKNLKITNNAYDEGEFYAAGFFGFIDAADAQIVNLTIDGADVNGHHWTGVIAGYLTGKISNCTVKNATVKCTHANDDACGDKAGVIVGYVNKGTVTNNTAQNSTVTAGRDAGQIAGCAKADYVYGNTATNVTVTAAGGCTGANINNAEIGRKN